MEKKELEIFLITQLILEYRTSLETISQLFNMEENDMYNKVISNNYGFVKYALLYVLDYETKMPELINQSEAKKGVRTFLINFHLAKTTKEKLEMIKNLDNSSSVLKLKNKKTENYEETDFSSIIKYRYKYALTKGQIKRVFEITRHALDSRENKLDENMKKRIDFLNEYNQSLSTEKISRKK